uniref:ERM domain-containing protein n=1 Tax=Caenorhabditis tropicalis TaxID=1561998 RepID=A0A1I7T0J6_9PELO
MEDNDGGTAMDISAGEIGIPNHQAAVNLEAEEMTRELIRGRGESQVKMQLQESQKRCSEYSREIQLEKLKSEMKEEELQKAKKKLEEVKVNHYSNSYVRRDHGKPINAYDAATKDSGTTSFM